MRSEAERTGLLLGTFQVCTLVNGQLSNEETQFCEECLSAQPVGGVCMAVRGGGPLVLGELTASPVNSSLTLFLLYRVRHVFFLARQKENVGDILMGKAHLGTPPCGSRWGFDPVPYNGTFPVSHCKGKFPRQSRGLAAYKEAFFKNFERSQKFFPLSLKWGPVFPTL